MHTKNNHAKLLITCLSTTKVLSDEQFLIATHHRNWLFNMSNNRTRRPFRHLDIAI